MLFRIKIPLTNIFNTILSFPETEPPCLDGSGSDSDSGSEQNDQVTLAPAPSKICWLRMPGYKIKSI